MRNLGIGDSFEYLNNTVMVVVSFSCSEYSSCSACEFTAGSGSILAMVQTASQRTPDIICGKPHKPMIDVIVNKYNIDPKKTLMIGDRLVCSWFYILFIFVMCDGLVFTSVGIV